MHKMEETAKRTHVDWTPEEDQILRTYYKAERRKIVARIPGHTWSGIQSRAFVLGICAKRTSKSWSQEELDILHRYFKEEGINIRSRLPGRTDPAIRKRAALCGLSQRWPKWTEEEVKAFREFYPIEGMACAARFPDHGESAIRSLRKRLGIDPPHGPYRWTGAEELVLEQYMPTEGPEGCVGRLEGRTVKACIAHARAMGLTVPQYSRPCIRKAKWSQEEHDILLAYYPSEGIAIQRRLPYRTKESIYKRASVYGLKSPKRITLCDDDRYRTHRRGEKGMKKENRIMSKHPDSSIQAAIDRSKRETLALEKVLSGESLGDIAQALGEPRETAYKTVESRIQQAERRGHRQEKPIRSRPYDPLRDLPYPANLFAAVMGTPPDEGNYPLDWKEGLEYAMSQLTKQEQFVLAQLYQEGVTYAALAEHFDNKTESQVAVINDRACRKLRNPYLSRYFTRDGFAVEQERDALNKKLMERSRDDLIETLRLQFSQTDLERYFRSYLETAVKPWSFQEVPLKELKLSNRTYNALRRAGLDTVGDLLALGPDGLCTINSTGPTGREEAYSQLYIYLSNFRSQFLPADVDMPSLH